MADELPDFEFSNELESEFEQMRRKRAQEASQGQQPEAKAEAQASSHEAYSAAKSGETQFYAWQVCLADMATGSLSDADNYPNYLINRESITQMLGIGMASGQNMLSAGDASFAVAISIQREGQISLIGMDHPRYRDIAATISEELIAGQDKGMVAELPNGRLIAVKSPVDPSKL